MNFGKNHGDKNSGGYERSTEHDLLRELSHLLCDSQGTAMQKDIETLMGGSDQSLALESVIESIDRLIAA